MLYIITAVHNRFEITKKFINSIQSQTYNDVRLLLVDDGSTDGTSEMVLSEMPDAIILKGNGNLWWGGALHKAYKYLSSNRGNCNYVMYANDDTRIPNDLFEKAIKKLENDPNQIVTACGYSVLDGRLVDGAVDYDVKTGNVTILPPGASGNCTSTRSLFMTYDTYKDIGGFHPYLLPHYASDYEYTIRAARKGHQINSYSDVIYEFDPGTTGYNSAKNLSLKKVFSKRSKFNPFYRLVFTFMVTPIRYIPNNIYQGIKRIKGIAKNKE